MFAICTRYEEAEELRTLPPGPYLCADCAEKDRAATLKEMINTAKGRYGAKPGFFVQLVVVSGILQWRYQLQLPLF